MFSNHTSSKERFSKLVIEEDTNEEGEGWNSEVLEWNLSGSKSQVQNWDVEENGYKRSLEEKSEVTHGVNHTLL